MTPRLAFRKTSYLRRGARIIAVAASLLCTAVHQAAASPDDHIRSIMDSAGKSRSNDAAKGDHMKDLNCEFDNIQDMVRQVNERSLNDANKRGINLDKNRNGRNDALEGQFYATRDVGIAPRPGELGEYACSEFSAYLQCMLQELFNCSPEQAQSISGGNHMINRVHSNMFRRPPSVRDSDGYIRIEPQHFFNGNGGVVSDGLSGNQINVHTGPQPYRPGIQNTNYDELQCKPGSTYSRYDDTPGLFGGMGGSPLLSAMVGSLMNRMRQQRQQDGDSGGTLPTPRATLAPGAPTPTPTPAPTRTPTVDPFRAPTPVRSATPTQSSTLAGATQIREPFDNVFLLDRGGLLRPSAATGGSPGDIAEARRSSSTSSLPLFGDDQFARPTSAPVPTISPYRF